MSKEFSVCKKCLIIGMNIPVQSTQGFVEIQKLLCILLSANFLVYSAVFYFAFLLKVHASEQEMIFVLKNFASAECNFESMYNVTVRCVYAAELR